MNQEEELLSFENQESHREQELKALEPRTE